MFCELRHEVRPGSLPTQKMPPRWIGPGLTPNREMLAVDETEEKKYIYFRHAVVSIEVIEREVTGILTVNHTAGVNGFV